MSSSVDGPDVSTGEVPGYSDHWGGSNCSLVLIVVGAVAVVAFLICAGICSPQWPWFLLAALTSGAIWLAGHMAWCYESAWGKLKEAYRDMQRRRDGLSGTLNEREAFIAAFAPSQELVSEVMNGAAERVVNAYANEIEFHRNGLGLGRMLDDPEARLEDLRNLSQGQRHTLREGLVDVLTDFNRLRDLARSKGYKAYDSWKKYANTSTEGVEGRNELPGE